LLLVFNRFCLVSYLLILQYRVVNTVPHPVLLFPRLSIPVTLTWLAKTDQSKTWNVLF
jgi:hypothetical protein